jgi:hypothetical protein
VSCFNIIINELIYKIQLIISDDLYSNSYCGKIIISLKDGKKQHKTLYIIHFTIIIY